jgi:glycosyltransferase involved in cell wall biosynthesis
MNVIPGNNLHFTGQESVTLYTSHTSICDTFTIEFWVKAEEEQQMDFEASEGDSGIQGKRYAFAPEFAAGSDAGMGISIGTNGISVYEHAANYLPARLVCPWDFREWQHVAIVYREKTPHLYLNGRFVKTGLPSARTHVFPPRTVGGCVYGYFKGELGDIRIWRGIRIAKQLAEYGGKPLDGNEPGLFWYENPSSGIHRYEGKLVKPELSVIMPSLNRFPLCWFALLSLKRQTLPADKWEVLFIDDGSTDGTSEHILSLFEPTFPFKLIRHRHAFGRGQTRNRGIRAAAGSVLLFLDAEMLVAPDLLATHLNRQLNTANAVVSGSMRLQKAYTVIDPRMSPMQKQHISHLYYGNANVSALLAQHNGQEALQLFPLEDLEQPERLKDYTFTSDYFLEILDCYDSQFSGFHYAWTNFITSNVSIPKALIERAGGFDEQFKGFGWEDWELGYRLTKHGAVFIHDETVAAAAYHQEHPIAPENREQSLHNFYRFGQKHPVMEVRLFVLDMIPQLRTLTQINPMLDDYKRFRRELTNRYHAFDAALLAMLEHCARLLAEGKPIETLWEGVERQETRLTRGKVAQQAEELRELSHYSHLLELYDFLLSMA